MINLDNLEITLRLIAIGIAVFSAIVGVALTLAVLRVVGML
jgi:hypothetical protein